MSERALTVTQLLRRMKNLLEIQIGSVWVEGEVSNLRKQPSGHWYFSLKDEGAQISCAMFGAKRRDGAEALADGGKVRVLAEASVYEARGQLQVIIQRVEPAGLGDLQRRFEELKRRLQAEGLFDAERKKPLPGVPRAIGLITSATGAALQDMLKVLSRRAPWVQPVLYPVRVQGKGAEYEIAEGLRRMGQPEKFGYPRCDVLIVGRGGGSLEDLWCFNEEVVARALAACPIPVISAVGHEIDFTIADFVADLRAPTPSAAAELAVADGTELSGRLGQLRRRLAGPLRERMGRADAELRALRRGVLRRDADALLRDYWMRVDVNRESLSDQAMSRLEMSRARLGELRMAHASHRPDRVLERRSEAVAGWGRSLEAALRRGFESKRERLLHFEGLLRALGPDSAFQRGFSITLDVEGRVVRSVESVETGMRLVTRLADGQISSSVDGVERKD